MFDPTEARITDKKKRGRSQENRIAIIGLSGFAA